MMNRKVLFWPFLRSFGSKRPRSSGRRCCGDVVHCASRGSQPRRPDDGTGNGNAHGRRHEHRDAGHDEEDDAHPECGGEEGAHGSNGGERDHCPTVAGADSGRDF